MLQIPERSIAYPVALDYARLFIASVIKNADTIITPNNFEAFKCSGRSDNIVEILIKERGMKKVYLFLAGDCEFRFSKNDPDDIHEYKNLLVMNISYIYQSDDLFIISMCSRDKDEKFLKKISEFYPE